MKKIYLSALLFLLCKQGLFSQTPVIVDLYKSYQTITGFGGHDPRDQTNLMTDDLGITVQRIWLDPKFRTTETGAYNFDGACSPSKAVLLGLKAKGVNTFIATPWSPPAWMKVNNTENGGVIATNVLKADMYTAYADYLVEYAKQFKAQIGVNLYGISIQNEPRFDEPYPSCIFTPTEMRDLIKLIGPKLKSAGLTTTIYCAEDMGGYGTNMPWFQSILGDSIARKYVGIWAVHGYTDGVNPASGDAAGWSSMSNYLKKYNIPLWMTETSGYFNNWTDALKLGKDIHVALKYGKISAWFWWRLVVATTESYWEDEALVMGSTPNKTFYTSKNYFKYIRPGAQQIESSCSDADVWVTAFSHGADKRLSLVLINNNAASKTLKIQGDKLPNTFTLYTSSAADNFINKGSVNTSSFTIPGNSINTLVYNASNKQPTIDKIDTLAFLMKSPGQAATYSVDLTGISDGGGEGQSITLNATNSNTGWFSTFTTSYLSPQTTGKINFSPIDNQIGNTNVAVTLSDGSAADNGFFSQQNMTFVIKLIPFINHAPTVIYEPVYKFEVANLNRILELTGITDGEDGSQKISISVTSSDENIVTNIYVKKFSGSIADINLIPRSIGDATLTITIRDDGGKWISGQDTKIIKVKVQVLESYDLPANEDPSIRVYPNPAGQYFIISNPDLSYTQYTINDISGRMVAKGLMTKSENTIDTDNLSEGVYVIRLTGPGKAAQVRKLIVKK